MENSLQVGGESAAGSMDSNQQRTRGFQQFGAGVPIPVWLTCMTSNSPES